MSGSLTEVLFSGALKDARLLDKEFQDSGKCLKPLHGLPVTIKDQFDVEGVDTTLGYVGRSFRPAAENAVLVTILKSLGAVILAKSNLPQSILVQSATQTFGQLHSYLLLATDNISPTVV